MQASFLSIEINNYHCKCIYLMIITLFISMIVINKTTFIITIVLCNVHLYCVE